MGWDIDIFGGGICDKECFDTVAKAARRWVSSKASRKSPYTFDICSKTRWDDSADTGMPVSSATCRHKPCCRIYSKMSERLWHQHASKLKRHAYYCGSTSSLYDTIKSEQVNFLSVYFREGGKWCTTMLHSIDQCLHESLRASVSQCLQDFLVDSCDLHAEKLLLLCMRRIRVRLIVVTLLLLRL